jgi:sialidase-1
MFVRCSLLLLLVFAAARGETSIERTDLFVAGEGGYALYRIPALVVTPQQTLLAACEARKTGRGDWDHVDIFLRRSIDSGRNWEQARCLVGQSDVPAGATRNPVAVAAGLGKEGAFTLNNPTWIADSSTGETHLLYCLEYARAFMVTTRDGGKTFSASREITSAFDTFRDRDGYAWRVLAIGPGHGVRLSSGRLVAAVWLSTGEGGHAHRPSACATIYSDNHGVTWQAGEIVARDPAPLPNPSECAVAEPEPGRVIMNIRSESPRNRRAFATSRDGATGWSAPSFDETLWEPVCMAGFAQRAAAAPGAPNLLLFSNPASLEISPKAPTGSTGRVRKNLTLRVSLDGGKSWPRQLVLETGPSAYSDLAFAPDGTILCFFENGSAGPYEKLTIARIPPGAVVSKADIQPLR